jgi:hypothetical protein
MYFIGYKGTGSIPREFSNMQIAHKVHLTNFKILALEKRKFENRETFFE